jgi:hypothetical protein
LVLASITTISKHYAAYLKGNTNINEMSVLPYQKGSAWMVDMNSLLSNFGTTSISSGTLTATINGKKLVLKAGSTSATYEGQLITLTVAPELKGKSV